MFTATSTLYETHIQLLPPNSENVNIERKIKSLLRALTNFKLFSIKDQHYTTAAFVTVFTAAGH